MQGYLVEPAWQLDFGKYWIDEDILKESYNDRAQFFDAAPKFVHTVDVFETDQVIYLHYRYKSKEYTYLYNKSSKESLNISEFTENSIGWIGKPLTTWNNYIVNVVTPFDARSGKFNPGQELKKEFAATDEEGRPVLVFVKFDY